MRRANHHGCIQIAVVPVNRIAAVVQLIPREGFDFQKTRAAEQRLGEEYEYNFMRGTPYSMRRRMLLSPSNSPARRLSER